MSPTLRLAQPGPQADLLGLTNFNGGDSASDSYLPFATDSLSEKRTQAAYQRNARRFLAWTETQNLTLGALQTHHATCYRDELVNNFAASSVNQHLSTLRGFFDRLILDGVLETNPFLVVHGITLGRSRSKRPRPSADETRRLLLSIETSSIAGLRDKALIASIVFSPVRLGTLLAFNVADYRDSQPFAMTADSDGDCRRILGELMDAYVVAAGIAEDSNGPLFRTISRARLLTKTRMSRCDALRMIRRRGRAAGLAPSVCCCRSLRAALNQPCRPA